ncbi:protein kinase [Strigomonas culicis]|uniref:Protein kinase n=1 Tax=Strigomonas culicis TaxID=28005 RepID=S9UAP2_9TRYP|nr:protein kinase [Strigomonas culicis]EPY30509.1 protein kinase [Strigomonas culicis]|eukprot:EPY25819.1 protein kinase [Strigomonas culicis]
MKGGTLFELLTTGGPLPEDRAGRLTYQLLQGLDHLHKSGVMHRDIKPENLFFRSGARDVIVIGDFGFATTEIPSTGYMGSPQYSAPELALIGLHRDEASALKAMYNEKCDLWSIGVVLFVMLTGLLPFDGLTPNEVFTSVVKNTMPFNKPACRAITPSAKQFILSLTASNPSKRPTATAALRSPWLSAYKY